jgi:hypothetical protein
MDLGNEKYGELVHEALTDMWTSMAAYTNGDNAEVVWNSMLVSA